jgi:hypothetical protein
VVGRGAAIPLLIGGPGDRQRIGSHIDTTRTLVAANALSAKIYEIGWFELRARLHDHDSVHRFAPLRVGNADYCALQNGLMLGQPTPLSGHFT